MKKKSALFIALLCTHLFANDFDEEWEVVDDFAHNFSSEEVQVYDKQENYFLTSTEYRIPLKVNPVTGTYSEEEEDLYVAFATALYSSVLQLKYPIQSSYFHLAI